MNHLQPEELSALLDGELSRERTVAVQEYVQADPAVQHEFASLSNLDLRLRATAAAAAFVPLISLPGRSAISQWIVGISAAAGLTLARLAPLYLDSASIGLAVNSVMLVLLLGFVIWLVRTDDARQGRRVTPDLERRAAR